jgi:phage anti-repressor protein
MSKKETGLILYKEEIIPIENNKELGLMVNSRLLHEKLRSGWQYANWIKERIGNYGFEEGKDFLRNSLKINSVIKRGRPSVDYVVTLDMAKELSMIENNKTGRLIRRYFIEIEKRYRDWIGFILPRLEIERNLFGEMEGYNYMKLLMSCGCSVMSSSVHGRIRKNKQEFWKNQVREWIVSERFGRIIVANAVTRKLNQEAKERRIAYKEKTLITNH